MADDATNGEDIPAGNFWTWLRQHKNGSLHSELSEKLADITLAVIEHGKAGSLTLTIKINPSGDGATVFVADDIKENKPKADRGGNFMFVDGEGILTRNDPNQMQMPIRVVETETGEPVTLDTTTGEVREIR